MKRGVTFLFKVNIFQSHVTSITFWIFQCKIRQDLGFLFTTKFCFCSDFCLLFTSDMFIWMTVNFVQFCTICKIKQGCLITDCVQHLTDTLHYIKKNQNALIPIMKMLLSAYIYINNKICWAAPKQKQKSFYKIYQLQYKILL